MTSARAFTVTSRPTSPNDTCPEAVGGLPPGPWRRAVGDNAKGRITAMEGVHLRRLESNEMNLHREVRLRALRDAPDSFADTFTDVAARPASYWEDLTRSVAESGPSRDVPRL